MMKSINGYNIWVEGTWCEVTKNGEFIYEGTVSEDMTCEDVYRCIEAKIVFKLNGKFLMSYDALNEGFGEREVVREQLAYENNCKIEDIEVVKELAEINSVIA